MSYLEPGPMPRRQFWFAIGTIPFGLLMILAALKLVHFGYAAPLFMLYTSGFVVWDARARKREQEQDE
jgi:hypothetical protein